MRKYRYSPLSKGPRSIRLLRLLPYQIDKAEIRAELLEYSLQDSQRSHHSYEALSYVWGGLNTTRSIFIGDEELDITPNLHAALLRFRDPEFPRILWVDAVCINQRDEAEKEYQIRSMAMIYGHAKCTIVWLGEEAESSIMALEEIRAAGSQLRYISDYGNDQDETSNKNLPNIGKAITSLLRREWFQRIWVLQEVAAARHVLVACGPTEIDGHAFCLGLEQSRSVGQHTQRYAQIRPVINLIRGAIFRPRFTLSVLDQSALNICSLGELMSMYHNLNATHRHDRVFALLGMATDDIGKARLLPDYSVPWDELFRRLLYSLCGAKIHIQTWPNNDKAEISGLGGVIGSVHEILRYMDGRQRLQVKFNDSLDQYENYQESWTEWTLEATVNDVRSGDIIYLLEESPKPMIIRRNEKLFDVVVLAMRPPVSTYSGMFPRNLRLVWNWVPLADELTEEWPDELAEIEISWTAALILADSAEDDRALEMIAWLITAKSATQEQKEMDDLPTPVGTKTPSEAKDITEAELIEVVQRFPGGVIIKLLQHKGHDLSITEAVLISTIQWQNEEVVAFMLRCNSANVTPIVVTAADGRLTQTGLTVLSILLTGASKGSLLTADSFKTAAEDTDADNIQMLAHLLDFAGGQVENFITEAVLIAAVSNPHFHVKVLKGFLANKTIASKVTENVIKAGLGNRHCPGTTMKLLLECMPSKLSDEVTIAAFRGSLNGHEVLSCLLDHRTQDRGTTEALWLAVANNTLQATTSMRVLIEDHKTRQTSIYITEAILVAAAGNHVSGAALMEMLLGKGWLSDVQKTQVEFPDGIATPKVLIAAARNRSVMGNPMWTLLNTETHQKIDVSEELIEAVTSNPGWPLQVLLRLKELSTEATQWRVQKGLNAFFWTWRSADGELYNMMTPGD